MSELNNMAGTQESDQITIDLHNGHLYIYPRFELWKDVIFRLDGIAKVLFKYDCCFYLSGTRYKKPTIVVSSVGQEMK